MSVECLNGLQTPGPGLSCARLQTNGLVSSRGRNETRAGVRNLDPMAARLKNVQEESLLDSVLVWACLDLDAGLQKDVCGA
jgi:hypothetical protein